MLTFEDNDGDEKTISLKDWEQSDDDDLGTDLEEDEEEENGDSPFTDKKEKEKIAKKNVAVDTRKRDGESLSAKKKGNQPGSIPFIIHAPKNFEELSSRLENCSNADVIEIISRIRATDAIKLAAENRKKMQV